jgi:invasion protein IalB
LALTEITARLALGALLVLATVMGASAQEGGSSAAKKSAPTPAPAPNGAPNAAQSQTKVEGSFGSWTLLCGKEGDEKAAKERCSLVLPLVEKETQKLVFRVIVTYSPQGKLVLRVDGPTGVALQRGVEFSPDTKKIYRMAFQTCLPMGCKALLLVSDDLRHELAAAKQGAITVYALNGKPVQTVTSLEGFAQGLAALDAHLAGN